MKNNLKLISILLSAAMIFSTSNIVPVQAVESIKYAEDKNDDIDGIVPDIEETEIAALFEEDVQEPEPEIIKTPWSVYIYMIGGNSESLYATASDNIAELLGCDESDDVQVVLQAGGAKEWHLDDLDIDIEADRTRRFVLNGSEAECVYDEEATDMTEETTLCDFLSWSKENYPSEKSIVILYGDGKGYLGLGSDELYGDRLSIADIASAFKNAEIHTDILAFDASFMAEVEVMSNMSPYADYMIASENVISEEGFDYATLINSISDNPYCRPTYLSRKICDSYFERSRENNETYITLSVTELALINPVIEGMRDYVKNLESLYSQDQMNFSELLSSSLFDNEFTSRKERDLKNMAEKTSELLSASDSEMASVFYDAAVSVDDAVRNAVCYKVQGRKSRATNGILCPYGFALNKRELAEYELITSVPEYCALMDAVVYGYHPSTELYETVDKLADADRDYVKPAIETVYNGDELPLFSVIRGKSNVSTFDYSIIGSDDEGRSYVIQNRTDVDVTDNYENCRVEFDGKIATINGEPVVLQIDKENSKGAYYNVPISVVNENGDNEDRVLYVYYDYSEYDEELSEDERYQIIGMHKISFREKNFLTYDMEELSPGSIIRAAYPKTGAADDYKYGNDILVEDEMRISMESLPDGQYGITYYVVDGFNSKHTSGREMFYVTDGEISMRDPSIEEEPSDDSAEEKAEAKNSKPKLPIVSYKEFYGEDVPERLKDIHYSQNDTAAESEETDADSAEENAEPAEDAGDASTAETDDEKASVTMLMYITGANLEGSRGAGSDTVRLAADITESEDVNIVIETGGAPYWKYEGLDSDSVQRFEAHEGKLVEVSKEKAYNMSTGASFSEFLNWGISNYPAEHYIIYSYDHGAAWFGTNFDDNFDGSNLTMKDWQYALESTGVTFDAVIFDECLMATWEVAEAIAPYADYMTAYEVSQISSDYEWNRIFEYLANHSEDFDAKQFGKTVVDMNADTWEESLDGIIFQTMSLIDLSKIGTVSEEIDEYASELIELVDSPAEFTRFIQGVDKAHSYQYEFQKDIFELMDYSVGISKSTRQKVKNAVDDAVVYRRSQFDHLRNCGLTMYFDISNSYNGNNAYAELCPSPKYVEFLDKVTSNWHARSGYYEEAPVTSVNVSDYNVEFEVIDDYSEASGIRITSNEEAVYNKSYQLLEYDEEQGRYYGYALRSDFTEGDGGEYFENFDGRVASIDGVPCYMKFDSFDEDRILYTIPVYSNYFGDCTINVAFYPNDESDLSMHNSNPQNGRYEIIAITADFASAGVPERDPDLISYGEEITVLLPEFAKDGKEMHSIAGGQFTYSEDTRIKFTNLDDGEYILRYTVENGLKKKSTPKDVFVNIENGRILSVDAAKSR